MNWIKDLVKIGIRTPVLLFLIVFRKKQLPAFAHRTILSLGPVYIKFFQVLSTRTDMFSPEYIAEFTKLRDQVPPEKESVTKTLLQVAYPKGLKAVFKSFNMVPIGAGCVCQVHEAVLNNNTKVAVKILRPNVELRIKSSFVLLKGIINFITFFSKQLKTIDVIGIIRELEVLLLSQTDLNRELENIVKFKKASINDDFIIAPEVYPEYSNKLALVMEFMDSFIKPYDFRQLNIDPLKLAETVDNLQDVMIFNNGVCHADLHPGNFFWTTDGKLVLIDFGLIHEIPLIDRNHVLTFYLSIVDGYYDYSTRYFLKYFAVGEISEEDYLKAEAAMVEVTKNYWVASKGRPQFSDMFVDLLKVLSKYNLKLKTDLTPIFLTLITLEGYLYSLHPSFDMLENVRKKRLTASEYTSMPEEAENLILGEFGTYSTALFEGNAAPKEAYERRDKYILEKLNLKEDDYIYDIGCGRGSLLEKFRLSGIDGMGITISKPEYQACLNKGLVVYWTSWEESSKIIEISPKASAITVIEMIFHLASLHENKEGLLDERLYRFFKWTHSCLKPEGKMFLQTLNIKEEFLYDQQYKDMYEKVYNTLPWMGFSTIRQIKECSKEHFDLVEIADGSSDLLKTYNFWKDNIIANEKRLRELIKPRVFSLMVKELDMMIELSEKGLLTLHRTVLHRKNDMKEFEKIEAKEVAETA